MTVTIFAGTHGTCFWEIESDGTLHIFPGKNGFGLLSNQNDVEMNTWHLYAEHIKRVYVENGVSSNLDASFLFYQLTNCEEINIENLDTSNTELMSNMFAGCTNLRTIHMSTLNTSKVTNTSAMFYDCAKLSQINLSALDFHQVTDVSCMFHNCPALDDMEIKALELQNTNHIFGQCSWPKK